MSNNIDKRIVEMQFDNQQFERGIQTSVKSLDNLKKSLQLKDSAKGLSNLQSAVRTFSLAGINEGIQIISDRFSTLGIIGVTALTRITNASISCGKRMLAAFTIEPPKTGFSEYETQINAIQTILANTSDAMDKLGYSDSQRLEIVNEKLDELNSYADKTIYNFTEMTRNIGTFTAAGVELNTSVNAIKGIANLAAVSGSTSQQASTAMYQLSQALASGKVNLQDWNSVVNAGMGGQVFQKALMRTAKTMGVVGEEAQETFAQLQSGQISFRESLKSGWLTTDVLTQTLSEFAYDFEEIAKKDGITLEEAKEKVMAELTSKGYTAAEAEDIVKMAETATEAATKVKTLTQLFDTLKEAAQSGWTQSWELIFGDFEEAKELMTWFSDYFGKIIGESADSRNAVLTDWKNLGGRDEMIQGIKNIIESFANIAKVVKGAFREIFPKKTGQDLYNLTKGFSNFTERIKAFTENSEAMGKLSKIVKGVASAFSIIGSTISWVWDNFKRLLGMSDSVGNGFLEFASKIGDFIVKIRESAKNSQLFQGILTKIGRAAMSVRNLLVSAFQAVVKVFNKLIAKVQESGILTKIGENVSSFLDKIPGAVAKIREWAQAIVEYAKNSEDLKKTFDKVKNFFGPIITKIQEFAVQFKNAVKAFFDKDTSNEETFGAKMKARFEAFADSFSGWFASVRDKIIEIWQKIKDYIVNFWNKTVPEFFNSAEFTTSNIVARIKSVDWGSVLKTAFGIYAGLKILSSLGGMKSIGKGLKGIGSSLQDFGKGLKKIGKDGLKITKEDPIGDTLLKIAAAIGILVASVVVLSKMDTEKVMTGLGVISILAIELLAISILFGKVGGNGKNFLQAGIAVALLIIPIKILGDMDPEKALKGLFAIGVILTELGLFMRIAGKGFSGKSPFLMLSISVNLLVLAVKNLGELSVEGLVKGLIGLEVLFLELSSFMKKSKGFKASGLLLMSVSINLMVLAVRNMGTLDMETIKKGVIGLGALMLAFGQVAKNMKGASFGKAIVLLISMAGMLFLFTEAFKRIEGFNSEALASFSLGMSLAMMALSKVFNSMKGGGIAKGIIEIGLVIAAFGAINEIVKKFGGDAVSFMESGGEILGAIGRGIGSFIKGIIGDMLPKVDLPTLPELGMQLSLFMVSAKGFIDGAKQVDGSALAGVGYLAAAIIAIGAAEVVNAILTLFGGEDPIVAFAGQLETLGGGLLKYANSIKGFSSAASPEDISSSIETAKGLADINSALPATGGKLQDWLGTKDLALFGTNALRLGNGLMKYARSVKGFASEATEEDLKTATSTATGLADLNNSLPATGGKLQDWLGTKDLTLFSTQIVDLAKGLKTYLETVKGFSGIATEEDLTIATDTATALSDLNNSLPATGGKLQDWLGTKNLTLFSTQIVDLAKGLKSYLETVSGFSGIATEEDLTIATNTATALSDLNSSLPYTGGRLQSWIGEKNLTTFATRIRQLASGLRAYAKSISGFAGLASETDLETAKTTAMALATLNNSLPSTNGTLSKWVFGEKDLGEFGTNIGLLGSGLGSFAKNVSGISVEKSGDAIDVLDMVKNFIDKLDPQGGIWQSLDSFVNGDQITALTNYTGTMKTIGLDLSTFATKITDVKIEDITYASTVFEAVSGFISSLSESGGVLESIGSFFAGDKSKTLTKASGTMADFGNDFKAFADGISTVTTTESNFEGAKRVLNAFKTFNDTVSEYGDIKYSSQMSDLLWIMEDFGTHLAAFGMNLGETDVESLSSAAAIVDTLVRLAVDAAKVNPDNVAVISSVLDEYGKLSISGFATGFTEGTETITTAITGLATTISGYEENFTSAGTTLGSSLANALGKGISDKNRTISSKGETLGKKGASGANLSYMDWYYTGQNLATGLGNGISSMAETVRSAAVSVASGAIQSIQMTWSVNSPSKVGEDLGKNWDLGLAGGIDAYASAVSTSSANAGNKAIDSAKLMLANLTGLLASGIDAAPTIRPVLDLSDVQNGIGTMNGMFSSQRSFGMSMFGGGSFVRGANALNFDGAKIVGGMSNKDVVTEIRNLNSRFNELTDAVSNMQLVLDTGVLVGQTSAKMDRQLGIQASRKGRGN